MNQKFIPGEREKNVSFYTEITNVVDQQTGEILETTEKTKAKVSSEPDFIKIYYETMMAFNNIHNVPTSFILSLSKFLEWTNAGSPQYVTLNKRIKTVISIDCGVDFRQIERYIKASVENGLLFRTEYRGVYEVNPFMIAKGKWESIKSLRANFDFIAGKWERVVTLDRSNNDSENFKIDEISKNVVIKNDIKCH